MSATAAARRPLLLCVGFLVVALVLSFATLGPTGAAHPQADPALTPRTYLPFVARAGSMCPSTSPNKYQSGTALQFDADDPVRPAALHADKNIALRGYVPTDPSVRGFVDYSCDDDTQPPQFATLFDPFRVPAFSSYYRVHDWDWEPSPEPGERGDPLTDYPVTALGLETTPGEPLHVPVSGYDIGGGMEVLVLFADHDTVALRYTREDSSGSPGYTVHIDGICTDPNLLALYNQLDDPDGPRYSYPNPEYPLPTLAAGQSFGVARGEEIVVAIADTGAFQDPRSVDEWWQERPSYVMGGRYPSDNDYAKQWALETIGAPGAWAWSTGDDVVIAVIDTGVDLDHPDLNGKILQHQGWNFIADDANVDDDHGHGTHVAGIAAAATDNDIGIAGTGWNAAILPLKVLDSAGQGYFLDVAKAITYAAASGVEVINMSLGPKTDVSVPCPEYIQDAVDIAYDAGVTLVAAAGNNGERDDGKWIEIPPANCRHVIGVAATTNDDKLATYSSPGSHVSTAAPGGDRGDAASAVYSTYMGGQYGSLFGTSMATPHVSGLAALLLARYPTYSPGQVASAILDSAVDLGDPGWDAYYGCGRIDASRTLSDGAHAAEPLCLEGATSSAQLHWQQPAPDAAFAPGEIIVRYQTAAAAPASSRAHAPRARRIPGLQAWLLSVPAGQERAVLARLRADPDVLYAELNYLVFAQ